MSYFYSFLCVLILIGGSCLGQDNICPPGSEFWPHWNCSLYYECDESGEGNHVILECGRDLYFNPEIGMCDFEFSVPECVEGTRPPDGTFPTGTTRSTTVTTTITPFTTTTVIPTSTIPGICPNGSVFWPVDHDCTKFYICVSCGAPLLHSCPSGYYFSPSLDTCDLQENVVECEGGTRPSPETTPQPIQCPPTGVHKFPHPTRCDAFYICINGVPDSQYYLCPEGLHFDPETENCLPPEQVDCLSP